MYIAQTLQCWEDTTICWHIADSNRCVRHEPSTTQYHDWSVWGYIDAFLDIYIIQFCWLPKLTWSLYKLLEKLTCKPRVSIWKPSFKRIQNIELTLWLMLVQIISKILQWYILYKILLHYSLQKLLLHY